MLKRVTWLVSLCIGVGGCAFMYLAFRHYESRETNRAQQRLISRIEHSGGKAIGWERIPDYEPAPYDCGQTHGRVYLGPKWAALGNHVESLAILGSIGEVIVDFPECSDDDMLAIAKLRHLESLRLVNGRITANGLRNLKHATNLKALTIHGNSCRSIDFEALRRLDLMCLSVIGGQNVKLRQLTPLCDQQSLIALEVVDCALDHEGPLHFTDVANLRYCSMNNTDVSDADLVEISALRSSVALDLSRTRISGEVIKRVKDMPELRTLKLNDVQISGDSVDVLFHMSQLESLEIDHGQFQDSDVSRIVHLSSLRSLSVRHTNARMSVFATAELPTNLITVRQGDDTTLIFRKEWIEGHGYGRSLLERGTAIYLKSESGFSEISTQSATNASGEQEANKAR